MTYIVDRRLNARHKSTVNRRRFLQRYREHIRRAVNEAVSRRGIQEMEQGESITIPARDIGEPVFRHGPGGTRHVVHSGNREFQQGDRIPKPGSGGGPGSGEPSDKGGGEDDFSFNIDTREFLNFLFEDLALPNLVKRRLADNESFRVAHGGIVSEGNPSRINIVRSMRQATMRRRALASAKYRKLRVLEHEKQQLLASTASRHRPGRINEIEEEILKLRKRLAAIPYIDTLDLRYNHQIKQPLPITRAVMFCIMDVSGSMDQKMKDVAKRFFILLYLFLQRSYEQTDVVFVRHHTVAKEVDEEEFFYSRETGGTIVSSALSLVSDIIQARYPSHEWNIYGAQASDGDNWNDDSPACARILRERLLPVMQYFAYVEIMPRQHQALWQEYARLQGAYPDTFAMEEINDIRDIYPVFRQLFSRSLTDVAI